MKFKLQSASDMFDDDKEIEINTLEELLELVKKYDNDIVLRLKI